jgi:hypothetical protein
MVIIDITQIIEVIMEITNTIPMGGIIMGDTNTHHEIEMILVLEVNYFANFVGKTTTNRPPSAML